MIKGAYNSMNEQIVPDVQLIKETKERISNSEKRKWNHKVDVRTAAVVACLCLTVIIGLWGRQGSNTQIHIIEFSSYGEINQKLYFDPETTHEEKWTEAQVLEYFGRNPVPAKSFNGLEYQPQNDFYVILNNDGTMNYDNFLYNYSEAGEWTSRTKDLSVAVSKGRLSPTCVRYLEDEKTRSEINGVPLTIVRMPIAIDQNGNTSERYLAEFMYKGLGYRVTANNLTQKEFIAVLDLILEN
ncbi:hypothetical protein OXPF_10070 [Oxobacter pfennigii]|uniref:DUF4367 domain-containing protein n=1 Tax=Oxobacter pfennigii TaxID=36849 RepID=A0A0P8WD27_9CLOT|nr:hypothetical protein [Oxobacter pfennigii]KPU45772.1 hypothetical protein OXPF_10070 [Oxobacter pfennigii]